MNTRTLRIIILTALIVRVAMLAAVWNRPGRCYTPDSEAYIKLAQSLIENGSFAQDGSAEIFRTPGYPLFLAFGAPFGENWWQAVIILQVVLDVALTYLVFLLGWMLVGQRTGLWAALFYAISPLAIAASVRILSDSLFTFLITLSLLLVVFQIKSGRWWALVAAACAMGAACYVRPVGLVVAVICAAGLLAGCRKAAQTGVFVGIVALIVFPWVIRNSASAQYWGFSSFAGDSVYFFAVPEVMSAKEGIPAAEARDRMREADARDNAWLSPGLAAKARAREARQTIAENPRLYAWIHLKGCLGFFLPGAGDLLEVSGFTAGNMGTIDVLHREGLVAAVKHFFKGNVFAAALAAPLIAVLAAQYLGAVLCIIRRGSLHMPAEIWLLAAVFIMAILLPGPFGLPRYRLPVAPLLCVAAVAGFVAKGKTVASGMKEQP